MTEAFFSEQITETSDSDAPTASTGLRGSADAGEPERTGDVDTVYDLDNYDVDGMRLDSLV